MKSKKEILEAGLLERYVFGETNTEEEVWVQKALEQYPELQAHLMQLEEDLLRLSQENAVAPPKEIKAALLKQITSSNVNNSKKQNHNWMLVAAGIVIALGFFSYNLYNRSKEYNEQLELVSNDYKDLQEQLDSLKINLAEKNKIFTFLNAPETGKYVLKGNALSPNTIAVGYVNKKLEKVYFDAKYLPQLSKEKDYQLWADVDGEMINMGVVKPTENLLAMNFIENAESINLTIEPAGGSEHPTVSNLIANVYLE